MEVLPASANSGISFQRTDVENPVILKACATNITSTDLCTTIGSGRTAVGTIEHLMAAFAGMGVDNALVRLNAPEVPIMDGSARPFVREIKRIGLLDQKIQRKLFVVKEPFEYRDGNRMIRVEPARETKFHCSIDYERSYIGKQSLEFTFTRDSFLKLAEARTFCHVNEVNALRSMGLAQGGSLENAIVVTDDGVLNEEGLRGDDEFVRHKILDCIGDLYLLGGQIVGKVTIVRPGHGLHADFMNRALMQRSRYFDVVEEVPTFVEEKRELAFAGGVVFG